MFLGSGFASESSTRPPSLLPLKLKFAAWAQHYIHILIPLDPGPWPEPSLRHYLGLGMWHEPNTCPLRFLTKLRLFSLDPKCQRTLCILSLGSLVCVCVCVYIYFWLIAYNIRDLLSKHILHLHLKMYKSLA